MKEIGFMFVGYLTFILLEDNRWYLETETRGLVRIIRKPETLFKRWNVEHSSTMLVRAI